MRETFWDVVQQLSPGAVVELCSKLVSIPSISGREEKIAYYLFNLLETLGYDEVVMDEMGNVIARQIFGGSGKRLLFEAQMDHVDARDFIEWSFYPYGAS